MSQTRPSLRPATRADYREFYGEDPVNTMRAYVAELDGKVVGIGGTMCVQDSVYVFSDMKDELRPFKVSIFKFAKKVDELLSGLPGVCIANPNEPNSERLLRSLGFEWVSSTESGEVYKWTKNRRDLSDKRRS